MHERYSEVHAASLERGEANDCAVRAVAIALDVDYEYAHDCLKEMGRRDRRGTEFSITRKTVQNMGAEITCIHFNYKKSFPEETRMLNLDHPSAVVNRHSGLTVNNVCRSGYVDPTKRYLAWINGHIFAIVDGEVVDWSVGRRFRIQGIMEVRG